MTIHLVYIRVSWVIFILRIDKSKTSQYITRGEYGSQMYSLNKNRR